MQIKSVYLTFEKTGLYMDIIVTSVGCRQLYKNKVETWSSHCPLERQMPRDVERTVLVSMETGTEERTTLKHCRADVDTYEGRVADDKGCTSNQFNKRCLGQA